MILLHPRILTFDPRRATPDDPWGAVGALLLRDGRVLQAGDPAALLPLRLPGEPVVEPEAAAILPGLIDTHAHLHGLGLRLDALERPDDTSPAAWADAVADHARSLRPGAWIEGRAWNQALWPPDADLHDGFPTHHLLSAAAPGNPVVIHRADRHAVWCNAAALRAAGLDPDAPAPADPHGGRILRLSDGRPSGVFIDAATDLITDAIPEPAEDDLVALIRHNARRFLAAGITCVHCALIEPHNLPAYERALCGPDAPGLRVRGMVYAPAEELAAWADAHPLPRVATPHLQINTLKAFADGALGSRGAWLLEPYTGYPDERGLSVATPEALRGLAAAAARGGWQLATHAIGDRAIRETLLAYASAADPETLDRLRWRVEHLQHTTPEDLDLAARLRVRVAFQPIHCTRDMRWAERLLGPARCAWAYPWRAALDRGLRVGFGSDWPIETLDPFAGLHAALTRQDEADQPPGGWNPHQRVTRQEALRAYTTDAAELHAADAGHLGRIGPCADLVALSVDPTTAAPRELLGARVRWTVVDGETAWGAPCGAPIP